MDEETLNQAIQLSKSGRTLDARKLLRPLLEVEPENEKAWLWYANSFDTVEEKISVLQNCLFNCPNSKMANDGLRHLMATLPSREPAFGGDASNLAADLQKENVQFTDSDKPQDVGQIPEIQYSQSIVSSPFHDNKAISRPEKRPYEAPHQENPAEKTGFMQAKTQDAGYMDSPFYSENGMNEPDVMHEEKKTAPGNNKYPTNNNYRIPFIILTVFGVILLIILGVIITILLISR